MGGWVINLLLSPSECERLRELGLPQSSIARLSWVIGRYGDFSPTEVYALLSAAGCPRLGFLLTNLDPRDPVEEAISSWRRWFTVPVKYERDGETRVMIAPCGFLVHTGYLEPLDEEIIARWGEGDSAELDARVAVDRELERLIELAEAGFEGPAMEGFFDRYIDAVAEVEGLVRGHAVRALGLQRGGAEGAAGARGGGAGLGARRKPGGAGSEGEEGERAAGGGKGEALEAVEADPARHPEGHRGAAGVPPLHEGQRVPFLRLLSRLFKLSLYSESERS
jgi:hypothetical protein